MHIAIIGAGISGLLSALELIEYGCQVSIYDQQQAGQAASWAGGGILSPMYPWRYPQAVNQLAQHGKSMYQQWNKKLKPITHIDFEIHNTGMLIFDETDFEVGKKYAEQFQDPMQICQHLTQHQISTINPQVSAQFSQALYFPQLANVRNPRLLQSVVSYLKQHPLVSFFEHRPIVKLQIQQPHVQYALDQSGNKIQADHFVIASGAWSQHWESQLKLSLPVRPVHGQMALFKTPPNWLPTMCMNEVMYLIPRQDGHIVCGSSMNDYGFDQSTKTDIHTNIVAAATNMIPELNQFPILKQWAGLRPSSPTGVPYIGQVPKLNNLWMNIGHFRNGLCMGPASAQLLRQLLLKQTPFVDPLAYTPQRLKSLEKCV
ncbi:NAD(P)/FAD-dependent oxidoreductase [Acinetobacter sp. MD2]|uniref:NAD(P)/FAD-dependent oxidoreductase n=1 Tax=Acinetobacter sp. MD2 TaxID=2600066 RepID=UPI002D1E8D3D|nr:FAD-dependent oxidoreductase [Acinetobacter sp. MD2]MEB3768034.1 FAD-dependent oxidoreductase [Acinetobacter sp. MD2]